MEETSGSVLTQKQLNELVKKARSPYVGERAEAERFIGHMGPEGIDQLVELVASRYRTWRKRRIAYFVLVATYLCIAVSAVAYCIIRAMDASAAGNTKLMSDFLGGSLGGIIGGGGGGILGGFACLLAPPPQLLKAASLLSQVDDLRGIGALARTLEMKWTADAEVRYAAGKALVRLLPCIGEENAGLLTAEDRMVLSRYLLHSHPEKEEELVLTILDALSWSGDSDTLRSIEAFQKRVTEPQMTVKLGAEIGGGKGFIGLIGKRRTPIADRLEARNTTELPPTSTLRDATQIALERLARRVQAAAGHETLLRPAESSESAFNTLLRPTEGAGTNDQALLLRMSGPSDGGTSG